MTRCLFYHGGTYAVKPDDSFQVRGSHGHAVPHSPKSRECVHFSLLWEKDVGGSNPSAPTILFSFFVAARNTQGLRSLIRFRSLIVLGPIAR